MNDGRFDLVEVPEGVGDLHDDGTSLFLGHQLVLLQIEVQVVPLAELQHCAEPVAGGTQDKGRQSRGFRRRPTDSSTELKCLRRSLTIDSANESLIVHHDEQRLSLSFGFISDTVKRKR